MTTTEAQTQPQKKSVWAWTAATFFGIGFLPAGPGTWASLATTLLWYIALRGSIHAPAITLIAAIAVTLLGIPAASIVEKQANRQDPGFVVLDEVAGQLFALLLVPVNIPHALLAFALFRLFDIVKPPPVRQLERLHGGLGIMMDDVAAGIYALLVSLIVHHWW